MSCVRNLKFKIDSIRDGDISQLSNGEKGQYFNENVVEDSINTS